ncbi:unnamed protein product [Spirodela intermedia]|uniref:Uncharacterized protein n=1 Tax=Spirodela intermedia TaxID=51605 RepID=A0A7I8I7J1_SPIIN|nr:unnamed protein product [Spirodela intermedia]CAA6653576.1 unnamed protein product [Spirodela intermedia]
MIMGAASSTVYYNLKMRHPTLNMPVIDYDLALLFQPMLMLGISVGVTFNVIFPTGSSPSSSSSSSSWMMVIPGTSTRAFIKGVETWRKETVMKKEAAQLLETSHQNDSSAVAYRPLPGGPAAAANIQMGPLKMQSDDINLMPSQAAAAMVCAPRKDYLLLLFVWVAFLAVQIIKTFARTCSLEYWILNALQLPIAASVTLYEAASLYSGRRVILSRGKQDMKWKIHQLFLYCCCGILAGIVGGLLGLGGGFILGPLFLELGVPPQVASATSTFAMAFSSSMSVIQYYILGRFPVPYAVYFIILATIAAFTGQHVVRRLIMLLGRASLIIFILALTIFVSAISLVIVCCRWCGIANMIKKLETKDYMGFESLCYR